MVLFTNWPRYTWRFAWPLITRYSLNQSWRFVNNSIPFWKQVHRVILNENEIQSNFDIEVLQCTFSVKIEDAPKSALLTKPLWFRLVHVTITCSQQLRKFRLLIYHRSFNSLPVERRFLSFLFQL